MGIGHTKLTYAHLINKTEPATCNTCNAKTPRKLNIKL